MGVNVSKKQPSKGEKEGETVAALERQRGASTRSNRSGTSYGTTGEGRRGSTGHIIKRTSSTATTDKPFERPLSQVPSGKSLASQAASHASIRTRLTSVSRSDYHEDLKSSLAAGVTFKLVFTTFIIVFGSSFQFGYNIGVLNQPVKLIKQFYNETYTERHGGLSEFSLTVLWSVTTAAFIPGGMAGAFIGGAIADKIGRKKSILFSHIFAFIGSGLSTACVQAKSPELLMVGRLFLGINSGIGNCLAPMYLSEISPYNLRGAFGTVHQLSITIGIFLSSVFGLSSLLGTEDRWPYLILLESGPALVSLLILPCLPDSPRYLLLVKGDRAGSEKALQFFRNSEDVSTDMEEMDTEHQEGDDVEDEKEAFTLKRLFQTKELRNPLFIACFLQIIQQFSGINAVFFYSNGIFENAGVALSQIPYAVVGTNAVNVAMTIISVPLMDIAGRRLLLLIPMLGMIIDLAIITMSLNLKHDFYWMNYISVACVVIYVICFAVGLGPIPMMIGAELFRQGPRPLAMAFVGVINWVATFIIALGFESLALACGDYTFIIFLVLMVLFTLFVFLKVPETKGKTFEEIAHQFAPGADLEVEEMVEDDVFGDDALETGSGDHDDHRLVSFYLMSQDPGEDEAKPILAQTENANGGLDNYPAATVINEHGSMPVPSGVPYIDASPASERGLQSSGHSEISKDSTEGLEGTG